MTPYAMMSMSPYAMTFVAPCASERREGGAATATSEEGGQSFGRVHICSRVRSDAEGACGVSQAGDENRVDGSEAAEDRIRLMKMCD
jgi:hypothetical protein